MVTYIYFVKCPDCEDEHFDFFDEAKAFALGCLSKKPIITQTEVCRNDFGECTDHSDLGTVWSWEEAMKETDAEPVASVFTKDNLKKPEDNDPEFDDDDFYFMNNSIAEDYSRRVSFKSKAEHDEFMKLCSEIGIITGEDLDRFMVDHNADDGNLLDKLRAYKDELDDDFELEEEFISIYDYGRMTKAELYDHLVNKEDTVEIEIGNQGYTLSDIGGFSDGGVYSDSRLDLDFYKGKFTATETYMSDDGDAKEGNCIIETESFDEFWNELMSYESESLVEKLIRREANADDLISSLKALETSDFQNRRGNYPRPGVPVSIKVSDSEISFSFKNTSEEAAERWVSHYLCMRNFSTDKPFYAFQPGDYQDDWVEVSIPVHNIRFKSNYIYDEVFDESCERKPIPEGMTIEELVEEMEENEDTVECTWCNDLFDKSECRKEVDLGWLCSRCEAAIKSRGETLTFREGNYWDFLDEEVEDPEIVDDLGTTYDGGYPEEDKLNILEEAADYRKRLTQCPECGVNESYDKDTGFCLECGFNI